MTCGNFERLTLILLAGLPGSGKTTFAHRLQRRLGAAHVESDAVRRRLFPEPRYTPSEHRRVFEEVERVARLALHAGRSVVVDATNLQVRHRQRFDGIAAAAGANIVCVWLTAPEATIVERLSRPRAGYSQADLLIYRRMRPSVERFSEPAIIVDTRFDTTPSLDLVAALAQAEQ